MATITQLRSGLKTRLQTIAGLTAYDFVPDEIDPPAAVVLPAEPLVRFDDAFGGAFTARFRVVVLASRVDDESGQDKLDSYLAASGAASVYAAVNADPDLALSGVDARVAEVGGYGEVPWGANAYYGASLLIEVFAT